MKQLFINIYTMFNTVVFLLIRMISRRSKIFCLDGNFVSDKPWFIQIRDRISAYRNKSRKSNLTNVRNIYKQSDELNHTYIENDLPHSRIIKYSELSSPDVHLKLRQHIRGNPLKYDTTQYCGMEQPFPITGIIPDG